MLAERHREERDRARAGRGRTHEGIDSAAAFRATRVICESLTQGYLLRQAVEDVLDTVCSMPSGYNAINCTASILTPRPEMRLQRLVTAGAERY
jgi:hypothetical protein